MLIPTIFIVLLFFAICNIIQSDDDLLMAFDMEEFKSAVVDVEGGLLDEVEPSPFSPKPQQDTQTPTSVMDVGKLDEKPNTEKEEEVPGILEASGENEIIKEETTQTLISESEKKIEEDERVVVLIKDKEIAPDEERVSSVLVVESLENESATFLEEHKKLADIVAPIDTDKAERIDEERITSTDQKPDSNSSERLEKDVHEPEENTTPTNTEISAQSVTVTRKVSFSDLSEEQQRELAAYMNEVPEPLITEKALDPTPTTICSTNNNTVTTEQYEELKRQHLRLEQETKEKQDQFHSLQERIEQSQRNVSLQEIKYKLLQNELQMNQLKADNSKLKFDEKVIQLEEKIIFYQKEIQKLNNQLKESQKKFQLSMKQNCSYYCHQQLSAGSSSASISTNSLPATKIQLPERSAMAAQTAPHRRVPVLDDEDDEDEPAISGGLGIVDSLIVRPMTQLFQSFISFVSVSKVLNRRIEEEAEKLGSPTIQRTASISEQGSPTASAPSPSFPPAFSFEQVFTFHFFFTLPVRLVDAIYYEYSFLYYLTTHSLPTYYPHLTYNILLPAASMIYSRLPLSIIPDAYNSVVTALFANEVVADLLNEANFQIYKFFQLLENEDNSTWELIENWYYRLNDDYLITSSLFAVMRNALPPTTHAFLDQYFLSCIAGVVGIALFLYFYRIIVGGILLLVLVLALPWIVVVYIVSKVVFLAFYCLEKVFIAPILYVFKVKRKKVTKKKGVTEEEKVPLSNGGGGGGGGNRKVSKSKDVSVPPAGVSSPSPYPYYTNSSATSPAPPPVNNFMSRIDDKEIDL